MGMPIQGIASTCRLGTVTRPSLSFMVASSCASIIAGFGAQLP
jgi:hypothetical protein